MPKPSLYERVLGDEFSQLGLPLQDFHRQSLARGSGQFSVVRPAGMVYWILGRLMGLPAPGRDIPLRLEVEATPSGEIWRRWFGQHAVITLQRAWHNRLIEAAGPVQLALRVRQRHGGMTMKVDRAWLLGVPLPRRLSPQATVVLLPELEGWRVRVRLGLPVIGEVTRYEGSVLVAAADRLPAALAR